MHKLRTIEMQRLSVDEFHEANKLPLIVVLDDVRSLHNVGSVFRSSPLPRPTPRFTRRHSAARTPWLGATSRQLPRRWLNCRKRAFSSIQ